MPLYKAGYLLYQYELISDKMIFEGGGRMEEGGWNKENGGSAQPLVSFI